MSFKSHLWPGKGSQARDKLVVSPLVPMQTHRKRLRHMELAARSQTLTYSFLGAQRQYFQCRCIAVNQFHECFDKREWAESN